MEPPFFTQKPVAIPSMNQVRIVDLPGLVIPASCKDTYAYHLLSAENLRKMVLAHNDLFQLEETANLLRAFDGCFTAVSSPIRTTAKQIALQYGRYLAVLLLTLKRGDQINRDARPNWRNVHWEFWGQIERVYVGGGLLAGHLGTIAIAEAQSAIKAAGLTDFSIIRSPYAAHLPLVGMARDAPAHAEGMLVFDFGQTSVKTAVAHYTSGTLTQISTLDSMGSPCTDLNMNKDPILARQTFTQMLDIIETVWRQAEKLHPLALQLSISMACYMLDGHPLADYDWGCYGRLQALTPHLQTMFTEQISARLGTSIKTKLHHDGAAAAMAHAGEDKTAVLTFGTAIGNGYPDSHLLLRPLAPSFKTIK